MAELDAVVVVAKLEVVVLGVVTLDVVMVIVMVGVVVKQIMPAILHSITTTMMNKGGISWGS